MGRVDGKDEARELAARPRCADRGDLEGVVRSHGPRLYATALRILRNRDDAQDAVQEGLLAACRAFDSFDGRARLSTWLHRIVVNQALMRLRTRRRAGGGEVDVDGLLPAFSENGYFREARPRWCEDPLSRIQRHELEELVRQAIGRLPDSYRVPLLLRDIEGWSLADVAEALGIGANAARLRVHRARQALKTLLDPALTGEPA